MARAARDDPPFADYVAARWAALLRTARLLTGDPVEADDLLQQTLVKAYARWSQVSAAEAIDAYVRTMMLNELLSSRRSSRRRDGRHQLVANSEHVDAEDPSQRLSLWSAIKALPPRQRAVLVLRYYEDLTEAQTAEALGCSLGTVKSQAHDALRTLRQRLGEAEEVNR